MQKQWILLLLFSFSTVMLSAQDWGWDDDEEETVDSLDLDENDSLDAAEAAFRFMFANHKSRQKNKYVIISWLHIAPNKYIDPDDEFVARFNDIRPRVKRISYYYNKIKKTFGKSILFYVHSIQKIDKNKIKIKCGYWESDDLNMGFVYVLEYADGEWKLADSMIEWQI